MESNPFVFYNLLCLGIFIFIHFLFRNSSARTKMMVLYSFCLLNIVILLIFLNVRFFIYEENFLVLFPLHLCYLSVFLIPLALKLKRIGFYNFIFFISVPGAFFAMIFPAANHIGNPISVKTITYFLTHFLVVAVPLWLGLWKFFLPKISIRQILQVITVLILMAGVMHFLNVFLVSSGIEDANYFFTLRENAIINNTLLAIFASIIPIDFFYLLPCILIVLAYMGLWNLGMYLTSKKTKVIS